MGRTDFLKVNGGYLVTFSSYIVTPQSQYVAQGRYISADHPAKV